jgi:CspA family cold shock protein
MPTGTIVTLTDRGFGFIKQASGPDLFFHQTALEGVEFDELQLLQVAEFEVEPDPQNPARWRAVHVRPASNSLVPELTCCLSAVLSMLSE